MDNDERDKMKRDIKNLRARQKREDNTAKRIKDRNKKDNNTSSISIDVVCDVTTGQRDIPIPTELIAITDTNTNLPMDVVCSSVNITQSVAGLCNNE